MVVLGGAALSYERGTSVHLPSFLDSGTLSPCGCVREAGNGSQRAQIVLNRKSDPDEYLLYILGFNESYFTPGSC